MYWVHEEIYFNMPYIVGYCYKKSKNLRCVEEEVWQRSYLAKNG